MADRIDRELVPIVRELKALGPRKCTPRAEEPRVGKEELEELLRAAGLGGPGQGRETARRLACDEKTLRRWRDPRSQADLAPPDIRIILRGRVEEIRRVLRSA